jgi:hypothetical protein
MYGETEQELLVNAKRHGIRAYGYTEETFNERIGKDEENFGKLVTR